MALAYGPQKDSMCQWAHAHALHAHALEGMKVSHIHQWLYVCSAALKPAKAQACTGMPIVAPAALSSWYLQISNDMMPNHAGLPDGCFGNAKGHGTGLQ